MLCKEELLRTDLKVKISHATWIHHSCSNCLSHENNAWTDAQILATIQSVETNTVDNFWCASARSVLSFLTSWRFVPIIAYLGIPDAQTAIWGIKHLHVFRYAIQHDFSHKWCGVLCNFPWLKTEIQYWVIVLQTSWSSQNLVAICLQRPKRIWELWYERHGSSRNRDWYALHLREHVCWL